MIGHLFMCGHGPPSYYCFCTVVQNRPGTKFQALLQRREGNFNRIVLAFTSWNLASLCKISNCSVMHDYTRMMTYQGVMLKGMRFNIFISERHNTQNYGEIVMTCWFLVWFSLMHWLYQFLKLGTRLILHHCAKTMITRCSMTSHK